MLSQFRAFLTTDIPQRRKQLTFAIMWISLSEANAICKGKSEEIPRSSSSNSSKVNPHILPNPHDLPTREYFWRMENRITKHSRRVYVRSHLRTVVRMYYSQNEDLFGALHTTFTRYPPFITILKKYLTKAQKMDLKGEARRNLEYGKLLEPYQQVSTIADWMGKVVNKDYRAISQTIPWKSGAPPAKVPRSALARRVYLTLRAFSAGDAALVRARVEELHRRAYRLRNTVLQDPRADRVKLKLTVRRTSNVRPRSSAEEPPPSPPP